MHLGGRTVPDRQSNRCRCRSRYQVHRDNSDTDYLDSPVWVLPLPHIRVIAHCQLEPMPTPHLSCLDRILHILSIESRSLVEMKSLKYSFLALLRISAILLRPAALVIRAIQSPSGVGQELGLVIQRDGSRGIGEERLLNNRVRCAARTDDVSKCVNNIEALRLNLIAVNGSSEPFDDSLSLQSIAYRVASLEIDEFVSCSAGRSDFENP